MKISELFRKPIERPINGVIKADQRDAESIWQELEEYVVTKQLADYFRRFFDAYLAALDNPLDSVLTARMGVWVSGFFGSGKSHFIKILSYLLENIEATNPDTGAPKRASEFFDDQKIKDPMLLADIQRATRGSTDVILFNIDAKADSKSDRDVLVQVFLRVFNEKLGFSGDAPHIAQMERQLLREGVYERFQSEFERIQGNPWLLERDAFDFHRDEVVEALASARKMSIESAARWFDDSRDTFKINIEGLAELLRDYINTKGSGHRVIFLVDEVGQFIGDNTQLMLNLQTIAEQLGTLCSGRAWVIVTSQEDIDAALGEANKSKSQDFSKIQGRFHTRLSLASSNTDEVIGERLLAKTEAAHNVLRDVFAHKGDIINNQISFLGNTVTMRGYRDAADYVANYPFAPYQFTLLQKIFEAIRKVGATGQHLSRGERSLLDAFQSAAKLNADRGTEALVPLYDFYPSIESFLDTAVKRSIDQAAENPALEPYDLKLLKTLFLIRHVAEAIKPTIDNLATLCVDEVDADKLQLKRDIQQSLERLERQRLVNRNGDQWFFLTNEERDIAREIGYVTISSAEKSKLLAEIIFEEILKGASKVRHRDTKADYDYNRLLDAAPFRTANHALTLDVRTPLGDDYESLKHDRCIMLSAEGHGSAIVRLDEGNRLDSELTIYRQIEKYVDSPKASTATPSVRRVLMDRKDENRERRERIVAQVTDLFASGTFYAKGHRLDFKSSQPVALVEELLNYLVTNTYNKLSQLKIRQADPIAEIRALLQADEYGVRQLALGGEEGNPQALEEVRQYLRLSASTHRVLLSDVVDRFTAIPYGWKPDWEVVLLVTRLFMAGEIKLTMGGSDLDPKSAFDPLTKSVQHKQIAILKRKSTDAGSLGRATDLYKKLFSGLPESGEDGLVADFRSQLLTWEAEVKTATAVAGQPHYPGKPVLNALSTRIAKQQAIRDPYEFIEALNSEKDGWLDAGDDFSEVVGFYSTQRAVWRRLLDALLAFAPNRDALQHDQGASTSLAELESIRDSAAPYGLIKQVDGLIAAVEAGNQKIVSAARESALVNVQKQLDVLEVELKQVAATPELRNSALHPMQQIKLKIADSSSVPGIHYLQSSAAEAFDAANDLIIDTLAEAQKAALKAAGQAPNSSTAKPTAPAPKPIQNIRASELLSSLYVETEEELDRYLEVLKDEVTAALKAGKRVRIR